jgi:hypothetical protein
MNQLPGAKPMPMTKTHPQENRMRLGQYLWGKEALAAEAQLVVLEHAALLPTLNHSKSHLNLIAAQTAETDVEFLNRIDAKLKKLTTPVKEAFFCLNETGGWKRTLNRISVARRITETLSQSNGRLSVISPRISDAQVSLELLTIVELIRRDYPLLNIQFRTAPLESQEFPMINRDSGASSLQPSRVHRQRMRLPHQANSTE